MNKNIYILGLVGAALFSACSTSDDLSIGDSSAVDTAKESVLIYEAGQNSEVPITLGVGQSRGYTRAPIGDESENPTYSSFSTEAGKYLGVFCLATDYQTPYKTNHPIDNNWKEDGTGLSAWMKNVPATTSNVDGKVAFLNHDRKGEQSYYYPLGNWMKYNFYTYYPWQKESVKVKVSKIENSVEVTEEVEKTTLVFRQDQVFEKFYTIDGSQDIIWGKATPPAADAFSANYFIENNGSAESPQLKFDHKLVQFKFYLKADNSKVKAKIKQVRDMYITHGINYLELVVADKNNPENNGNLYWFGNKLKKERMFIKLDGSDKKRFHQEDGESLDSPLENEDISDKDPVYVGYIMLAPPSIPSFNATYSKDANASEDSESEEPESEDSESENKYVYKLQVRVKCYGSSKDVYPIFELDPTKHGLETFEAGKIYNIVINIKSSHLGLSE